MYDRIDRYTDCCIASCSCWLCLIFMLSFSLSTAAAAGENGHINIGTIDTYGRMCCDARTEGLV